MIRISVFILICALPALVCFSQIGINKDNSSASPSAMLDVKSTNSGLLIPRVTFAGRNLIASPAEGLMVYCTNCGTNGSLSIYTNGQWLTYAPCTVENPASGAHGSFPGGIVWKWQAVAGAAGYKWNTTAGYETAADLGNVLTKSESGLECNETYSRFVWAYSICGESGSTALSATVASAAPADPAPASNSVTETSITWRWHPATGASGYRWSATNDFSTAVETGADTVKAEVNLACGTSYTRYIWACNGCGYSAPVTLTQSTKVCFTCGNTLTINHVAGAVAPVNKTVTYGTVNNVQGETAKCWITSNLGASRQATSVADGTEFSAGWYWQFNLAQGYKHDNVTRTPNTTWISLVTANSDWLSSNDPCSIELGSEWRIPTYAEWYNVDYGGNWSDWNGPWNSVLKLHAAGYLVFVTGSLNYRGTWGYYWTSMQSTDSNGWYYYFNNISSITGSLMKSNGNPIRCIRL